MFTSDTPYLAIETFHDEVSFELRGRNRVETGQLNILFHTFADLVE